MDAQPYRDQASAAARGREPEEMSHAGTGGAPFAARVRALWAALALCGCVVAFGADPSPAPAPTARMDETNLQETLRSLLLVQEQLHGMQMAIDRNRKETDAAAARSAEVLGNKMQSIEQALATQRAQELEPMQSSNRVMLIVAGSFAALGLLAMLLAAYFQWRTGSRLAEISTALTLGHALDTGPARGAVSAGDAHQLTPAPVPESNQRLTGAVDRLEKCILELEHATRLPLNEGPPSQPARAAPPASKGAEAAPAAAIRPASGPDAVRITVLLGKGQSLLKLDQAEEALACFDEVLELDANHSEALVKKGAALEQLGKLDEAVACYDQAIAANSSLTMAYLHKGGLFNRMERFSEALECYEQALRTQETRRG